MPSTSVCFVFLFELVFMKSRKCLQENCAQPEANSKRWRWEWFLPFTTSSAKLETPEPRGDWVTQRYRSWSERWTLSSWKDTTKRRWLRCLTDAIVKMSPLCLCKAREDRVRENTEGHHVSPTFHTQEVRSVQLLHNKTVTHKQVWRYYHIKDLEPFINVLKMWKRSLSDIIKAENKKS